MGSKYARWGPQRSKEDALAQVISWMAMEHKKAVDQDADAVFIEVTMGIDDPTAPPDAGLQSEHGRGRGPGRGPGRGRGRGQGRSRGSQDIVEGHEASQTTSSQPTGHLVTGHLVTDHLAAESSRPKKRYHKHPPRGSPWESSTGASSDSDGPSLGHTAPKAKAKAKPRVRAKAKASAQAIEAPPPKEASSGGAAGSKRPLPVCTESEQQRKEAMKYMKAQKKR